MSKPKEFLNPKIKAISVPSEDPKSIDVTVGDAEGKDETEVTFRLSKGQIEALMKALVEAEKWHEQELSLFSKKSISPPATDTRN